MTFRMYRRRAILKLTASFSLLPLAAACSKDSAGSMTVYKDPNCGCCNGWVDHVRAAGFDVTVRNEGDMSGMKKRFGVPTELTSCHTAEIGGYVVEGHVPASAIHKLLAERPSAKGLAVPGMPIGSPGMEGENPSPYDVMLFDEAGSHRYMRFLESNAIS